MTIAPLPLVAFDETGNTGQNLLDLSQPVFVLASVNVAAERAKALLARVIPPKAREAKFATLRTSISGRARIISLVRDGGFTTDEVRLAIYHKSFMVTTKIVDMLVETWHHLHGIDLYENAANLGLANLWHSVVPVFCGQDAFDEWQKAFVRLVRQKTRATVEDFYRQTSVLRKRNSYQDFDIDLAMLGRTRAVVDEGIRENDKTGLDPAIPSLVQLSAQWTAALGPFDLIHDPSKPVAYERDSLRRLLSVVEEPTVFNDMGIAHAFPIQAVDIRFEDSAQVPQLQLADLLAGSAGALYKARARGENDAFVEDLLQSGIANLVTCGVWPDTSVSPEALEAGRRVGSRGLDLVVSLLNRDKPGPT